MSTFLHTLEQYKAFGTQLVICVKCCERLVVIAGNSGGSAFLAQTNSTHNLFDWVMEATDRVRG